MKILHDLSAFPGIQFDSSFEKEGAVFFSKGRGARTKMTAFPTCRENVLFRIDSIWEEVFKGEYCQKRINSNFLALEHVIRGSLYVRQDDHMFLAEDNDFFLLRPGGMIMFRTAPEQYCEKESVILSGALLNSALQLSGLAQINFLPDVDEPLFREILGDCKTLSQNYQHNLSRQMEELAYRLFLLIKQSASNPIPQKLKDLIAYMEMNLNQSFTLEQLAEYYGCSVSHLIRIFHRYMNATPYQFLQTQRMKYAQRMLSDTELSIKEIAFSVGYENSMNFSTEFKKYTGKPPKMCRGKTISPGIGGLK